MPNYSIRDVESEFIDFLNKTGIPPEDPDDIKYDGRKHLYRIAGDRVRERNGQYCVYMDEWPAGYAKSYSAKHNVEYATWSFSASKMEYTEEERREWREKHEAEVRRRTDEEQRVKHSVAVNSAKAWENATEIGVTEHPYIVKKGVTNVRGVKLLGRELIVPVCDQHGVVHNIQKISPDGTKLFSSGGRVYGCYYRLDGDVRKYIFVCEGLATGLSIREATGCACVLAYNAGNLAPVVKSLIDAGHINIVLAADNDARTKGNPGINAAIDIADEYIIPIVIPNFGTPNNECPTTDGNKGATDWNDYVRIYGVEAAAESIYKQIEEYLYNKNASRRRFCFPDTVDNPKAKPKPTLENLAYLLKWHNISCKYNEISRDVEITIPWKTYSVDNKRNAVIAEINSLLASAGLKFESNKLKGAILNIADKNAYNPARDYILAYKWNGSDAIGELAATLHLNPSFPERWAELLLRKWLISGVAAAFSRGERLENTFWSRGVFVLLGPQSIGKTSWFRRLVPRKLFSEGISLSLDNKDDVKRAISTWITEFGELDGTFKRTDMARLKAFISNQFDIIRLPYADTAEEMLRRTIFCASVNRWEILQDETGSSRWWIVPVLQCDADNRVDIGQVWSQAYYLFCNGEKWWLTQDEEEELARHNEQFEPSNKFEDLILTKFNFEKYDYDAIWNTELTAMEVLKICGVLNPPPGECSTCSTILKKLTGHASMRKGKNGRRVYRLPPENSIYR